jgi:hypothetical protein
MHHDDKDQEKRHKRARDYEKQDQLERDAAISALLEHRHGRRYIWWLLELSNAMGTGEIFTSNALSTAFNCGEQNVGKQVLAHLLEVAPDGFLEMMRENADERANRDVAINANTSASDDSDDPRAGYDSDT